MKKLLSVLLVLSFLIVPPQWQRASAETLGAGTPYFDSFGTQTNLSGDWTVSQEPGVGTVMTAADLSVTQLNDLTQDFVLDFDVKLPVDTTATFSVTMRQLEDAAYRFTVGKDGLALVGRSEEPYTDTSVSVADAYWHSLKIALLDQRMAVWFDGIKVLDRPLVENAVSGKLCLGVTGADIAIANIALSDAEAKIFDNVADLDFSTDTNHSFYSTLWSFNEEDGIGSIQATESWATYGIASPSAKAAAELVNFTDYALEIKIKWNLAASENRWQRGIQINLLGGLPLSIFNTVSRYDGKDIATYNVLGTDWHSFYIVAKGTKVRLFIDKQLIVEFERAAVEQPQPLSLYTYMDANSKIELGSLHIATGDGIKDPDPDPEIIPDEAILNLLNGQGWAREENVLSSVAYDGHGTNLAKTQNFILNFTLNMAAADSDVVTFRLRHSYTATNNLGYLLSFSKTKATLSKFNDTDWQNVVVASAGVDFTKDVAVRVVANEGSLWIAFDGVKQIELTDAYNAEDFVQLAHYGAQPTGAKISNISLLHYKEETANAGIKTPEPKEESDILMDNADIMKALAESSWKQSNGILVNKISTGSGADVASEKNFVFDMTLCISPAEIGSMQLRVRHSYTATNNLGYLLEFTNSGVSLCKYNSGDWHSTLIKSTAFDFSKSTKVRVVANEKSLWVSLNGEKVFELSDAYIDAKRIMIQNDFGKADTVQLSDMCLYKYSVARANQVITVPPEDNESFAVADMMSPSQIIEAFKNLGYTVTETSISSTAAVAGMGLGLCVTKNFILDFDLTFKPKQSGALLIKFRHKYDGANFGYTLTLSRKSAVFSRYLEQNNGNSETYGTEAVDFAKGGHVRIAANNKTVWIAFNGKKMFELTDAAEYQGIIQVLTGGKDGAFTIANPKLTSFGEEESYAGMADRILHATVPKVLFNCSNVETNEDVVELLYDKFAFEEKDGHNAIKFSQKGLGGECSFYGKTQDFVLSFLLNMDYCSGVNTLNINIRKRYDDTRNYGSQITFTKKAVSINNQSETSYSIGNSIGKAAVDITGWVPVRIVAHGSKVAIFVNDQPVLLGEVVDTVGGAITFFNNVMGLNNIYFADMKLTEYYGGAIPEGVVVNAEVEAQLVKKNPVEKTIEKTIEAPANTDTEKGLPVWLIILIAVGGVAVLTGAGFGVVAVKKRKATR